MELTLTDDVFSRIAMVLFLCRNKSSQNDLKMLERTQANHEEMNFHFSRPHTTLSVLLLDEIDLMNLMSYSSLMKYMSS